MKHIFSGVFKVLKYSILIIFLNFQTSSFAQNADSKGTEFWICFPGNQESQSPQLFITSEQASTVTIDIPGIGFNQIVNITAGGLQSIFLPGSAQVQSQFVVDNKAIHITATSEITVYGMNAQPATTDAYLAFPLDALGNEYYVMAYYKDFSFSLPSQATIVATENNTMVTITTTITDGGFTAGVPTNIILQQGQVYQLRSIIVNADYTGTKIVADKPISVFGGAQCTNISGSLRACDHLVEQLPPLTTWGKSFVTIPLATRLAGDVFRFMAQKNATQVSVNGLVVANLNEGQFYETILSSTSYNHITSNEPILVGQYSRSSQADNVISDPFFALVPPDEQFLNFYVISAGTANIPSNYVNIASPTSNIGTVLVDGIAVNPGLWNAIPGTSFSGAKVPITNGVHTIASNLPIGLLVYGFGSFDSYGYLGGQSFAPIAIVSSLVLTPETGTAKINTEACFDAVVKDQNGNPLQGIRVDFTITGANPGSSGFAFTDANGIAHFCYTGANEGTDNITAAVGTITDGSTFEWSDVCDVTVSAKKFYDLNADGIDNDNMPVQGWTISLSGTDENNNPIGPINQSTNASGTTSFTGVVLGSYTISEGTQTGWINTTSTTANLNLTECVDPAEIKFGNVCIGAGTSVAGTFGVGYWTNKNGQSMITGSYLCELNNLCLRNANGSNFDPVAGCPAPSNAQINAAKTALKNWLSSATATNMSYMLSAQLAAMKLNVLKGYVNANKLIYAPGTVSANAAGFASVDAIMTAANNMLCANPIIASGNPSLATAEALKNALDKANNNLNFVQAQPCGIVQSAVTRSELQVEQLIQTGKLNLKAYPNPSRSYFILNVQASKDHTVSLRVTDAVGRMIETRKSLLTEQIIKIGEYYKPGVYFVQVIQGNNQETIKLIKQ